MDNTIRVMTINALMMINMAYYINRGTILYHQFKPILGMTIRILYQWSFWFYELHYIPGVKIGLVFQFPDFIPSGLFNRRLIIPYIKIRKENILPV